MLDLNKLKSQFNLVTFESVTTLREVRNESAHYPFGAPKDTFIEGDFIKITNPVGGSDTLPSADNEGILKLAAWHQAASERRGYKAI